MLTKIPEGSVGLVNDLMSLLQVQMQQVVAISEGVCRISCVCLVLVFCLCC